MSVTSTSLLKPCTIVDREFCLRSNGKWCTNASLCSQSLESIATEINTLKEQISAICSTDHDELRKWRLHTQETHPLSVAPKLLREHYNCRSTSQSYCKFLEILVRFPRLVRNRFRSLPFRSFHLCEAPGHFISALDRFICTFHSTMDWFWEANSLNPHNESTSTCDMILDDEIIVGHPSRWYFGKDGSGDIRKWDDEYLKSLVDSGRYDLVTADGSCYTQDVPSQQELRTLPLLEAELKIATELLTSGGSLVVKVYTFFMAETRTLIRKFASCFDEAFVFKPMSSKGGNSEVIKSSEVYFTKLQSSFVEANLRTYNTITKAELGVFRDCVLREFRKRTLATYIANPSRKSHLNSQPMDRPWMQMFGNNYVENLRKICDEQSAIEHLRDFLQSDFMNEYEIVDDLEVEYAKNEVEFIQWSVEKLIVEKALVDLCCCSNADDQCAHSLEFSGNVTVDVCKLQHSKDWFWLLNNVLAGVVGERISQLTLVWSAHSTPFVLSRFSASVIAVFSMMFFKFSLTGGSTFATFTMPNYPEDLPSGFELYISLLSRISSEIGTLHCFVPTSILAMLHPYLLAVNRRQWRELLQRNISHL